MKERKSMPRSYWLAALFALALTVWMLSGMLPEGGAPEPSGGGNTAVAPEPMAVQVRRVNEELVTREIVIHGETMPDRMVHVRAETTGRVIEVRADKGDRVSVGDVLVVLAMGDREARLAEAEALVRQRRSAFDAAQKLSDAGYQSESRIDQARAELAEARAELAAIEEDIEDTRIRAPFDGILDRRLVEVGDYVAPGTEIGTVVDNTPLIVSGQAAQRNADELQVGGDAVARIVPGHRKLGTVRYVSARADPDTHTFQIEVAVPNPDNALPSGTSAELHIPVGTVQAHYLSPAVLTLGPDGELGVKAVNGEDRVEFHPVRIVRPEREGVWVTGLPEQVRVITVGQGFVRAGEPVRTVEQGGLLAADGAEQPPETLPN